MLTQARAGRHACEGVGAIVFGEFPGCDEPGGEPAIRDVLREFTADFRGPVLFSFPSGHTTGPTWTLPFGVRAEVTAGPAPVAADSRGGGVSSVADSPDRRRRHGDGHAGGHAQASRPRRQRIRRARLSADERLSAAERITVLEGYRAEHVQRPIDLVVVGNAISRGNAELEAVLDRGPALRVAARDHSRSMAVGRAVDRDRRHARQDHDDVADRMAADGRAARIRRCWSAASRATSAPDGASYRIGKGKAFVIEGDEYDSAYFDKTAKFLKYLPDIAVVNNIEFDHADIYADLDEVRLAFRGSSTWCREAAWCCWDRIAPMRRPSPRRRGAACRRSAWPKAPSGAPPTFA